MIREQNGKYVLKSKDGKKTLGTHATREKALAQERAIQASKHGRRKKHAAGVDPRTLLAAGTIGGLAGGLRINKGALPGQEYPIIYTSEGVSFDGPDAAKGALLGGLAVLGYGSLKRALSKTSAPKKKKNDPLERMRKSLNKGRALGKSDKAKKKGFARLMKAIKKPEPEENKNLPRPRPN